MQQTKCEEAAAFKTQNTETINENQLSASVTISAVEAASSQVTNARLFANSVLAAEFRTLVGTSETIRLWLPTAVSWKWYLPPLSLALYLTDYNEFLLYSSLVMRAAVVQEVEDDTVFHEWLGGLIDGHGRFLLTKKGHGSLEIVMPVHGEAALYRIKRRYDGLIKLRAGSKSLRYRLTDTKGLERVIASIDTCLRNPIRIQELTRLCLHYNFPQPTPNEELDHYHHGWFSGFFDANGSVYLNLQSDQALITSSHKNRLLLEPLLKLYGGRIYTLSSGEAFKWVVYRRDEVMKLVDDYFLRCPSRTLKAARLELLTRYASLRLKKAHCAAPDSIAGKAWSQFLYDWKTYNLESEDESVGDMFA